MYKYLLSILLLISCNLFHAKPVIVISSNKITPYSTDYVGKLRTITATVSIAPALYWNHPKLIVRTPQIVKRGFGIAQETKGMDNLVHNLSQELEQKGWAQLSKDEKEALIKIIIAPIKPNEEAIKKVKTLTNNGYKIILATNQAIAQHRFYKETMQTKYGLNMNEICAGGTVSSPTYHDASYDATKPYFEIEPNWLVASDTNPSESYFKALRELADRQEPNTPIYMVHTFKEMLMVDDLAMLEKYNICLFNSIDKLIEAIETFDNYIPL